MAPSLAGSPRVQGHRDYVIKTLLHGMDGPIDGKLRRRLMAPMGRTGTSGLPRSRPTSATRSGTSARLSPPPMSRACARTRRSRKTFWKVDELMASLPAPLEVLPTWKASASHNPGSALGALNFASWTTGAPQQPGMWFQVELPEAATITEIQFNAAGSGFAGGGGTGARGARLAHQRRREPGAPHRRRRPAASRPLPACIQS